MNVVIDPGRQKLGLVAITAFNMVHTTILPNQLAKWNPYTQGNSRFHTVCSVFESDFARVQFPEIVNFCNIRQPPASIIKLC